MYISFLIGVGCGMYIAQNYNVPDMKDLFQKMMDTLKKVEVDKKE